jgi:5-methylcytosine-specific restriction endonuclease McrA
MAEWRKTNGQKNRDQARQWREQNPEKHKQMLQAWYNRNKEKAIADGHKRRAQLSTAGGEYTPEQWSDLKARYDHRCLCCGMQEPDIELTVDHVVPISLGGSSDISNLQPLCLPCNRSKHNKITDYRQVLSSP